MTNKDITIKQLESEKKEIHHKLELFDGISPNHKKRISELEDELFEVNDTIKKLNA